MDTLISKKDLALAYSPNDNPKAARRRLSRMMHSCNL